jgi:hypothetical protein
LRGDQREGLVFLLLSSTVLFNAMINVVVVVSWIQSLLLLSDVVIDVVIDVVVVLRWLPTLTLTCNCCSDSFPLLDGRGGFFVTLVSNIFNNIVIR